MEVTKQEDMKVQVDEMVEAVHCPLTKMFMPVENCQKCEKHDGIDLAGVSPITKRDLRQVRCMVPSSAEIYPYSSGDQAMEIVNCGPWKTLRPLTECIECGLHGGVVLLDQGRHKSDHKEVQCCRMRRRPCSYLAIGLKEVK